MFYFVCLLIRIGSVFPAKDPRHFNHGFDSTIVRVYRIRFLFYIEVEIIKVEPNCKRFTRYFLIWFAYTLLSAFFKDLLKPKKDLYTSRQLGLCSRIHLGITQMMESNTNDTIKLWVTCIPLKNTDFLNMDTKQNCNSLLFLLIKRIRLLL